MQVSPSELTTTRRASDSERSALEAELNSARGNQRENLGLLVGPSLTFALIFGLLWAILYGVGWRFFAVDLGLHSAAAPWILAVGALTLVAIIGPAIMNDLKYSKSATSALQADLALGTVEEMTIHVVEAIRMQEPEHEGFLFFLRTVDGRVYVQFDYESQDLGVDGKDPETSSYQPREMLNVVRTRHQGRVLASTFSGQPVPIAQKVNLASKRKHWPNPDSFCDVPWDRLLATYAA
jgi:hypothetical protein